ncbi:MAG: putative aliphatic sulfonates transport permease protein SsuC [Alphaproteobacteria bacterium MarineAlpha9_Bin4]|nr:ABC transporter permease [Pelagibacterales bacterium]PPR27425.1 MAG: putative aliphatic sulfonates transport permease protein SsuC [Alphaproteobacteria bacterium MarineAlpha9_Bin4]|tara:strand:- start:3121 stop:3888 length:768 start_codon:yes stop_codon:yes gene_type:complete
MINNKLKSKKYLFLIKVLSFFALFLFWEIVSLISNQNTFPSIINVLKTLLIEISDGELFFHLGMTLYRVFISFIIAMLVGIFVGILMGNYRRFDAFLDSWNILFLNIPALVLIILSYIWFGLTEIAAIIAVSLNKIPNVIVTIREGAKSIDRNLLQVALIYKVSKTKKFFVFYLPQLYPYIIAAARGGIALIWKIVLVVELLGRSNGVGFKIHEFFQFFDIKSILAYTIAFVVVMIFLELFFLKPLENYARKWRI